MSNTAVSQRQMLTSVNNSARRKRRGPLRTVIFILILVCCLIAIRYAGGGDLASPDGWQLILVNPWNELPDNYKVSLKQLDNGQSVDKRCYTELQEMIDACRAAGLEPLICSSYRSQDTQQQLFDNKVQRVMAQGYSAQDAPTEAAKVVALPGTSEHQLGLAVDIVDINNQNLDESQEQTPTQLWLMENSWRYGFILRYPSDKTDITGIIYEPWHYRYVGKEAAEEIFQQDICLEEYLTQIN